MGKLLPEELRDYWYRIRFDFPRATEYRHACLRLAAKAMELPLLNFYPELSRPGTTLAELGQLEADVIQRWLLHACEIDPLAGMQLLDALDFLFDSLRFLTGDSGLSFLTPRFKHDFTQMLGHLPFVFRVPEGWELSLAGKRYDEGHYGVGFVSRCHLSESTTHENWATGKLLGAGDWSDCGGFAVPCEIVPHFKRMPIDADDERWLLPRITAAIPVAWIRQSLRYVPRSLQDAPSNDRISEVADEARTALITWFDNLVVERQARAGGATAD